MPIERTEMSFLKSDSAIQWLCSGSIRQPTNGPAVTASVRIFNRTKDEQLQEMKKIRDDARKETKGD